MTDQELEKIKNYLNKIFNTHDFIVKKRKSIEDSCEVYHKEEFLGLIYKENEEGEEDLSISHDNIKRRFNVTVRKMFKFFIFIFLILKFIEFESAS